MNKPNIFKYTLDDIAKATERTVDAVREHKRLGRFDPEDLDSVSRYVVAAILESRGKK